MDRLVREYKRLKIIVALEREHLWNILINSRRPIETRRHLAKEIEIYERVIVLCALLVEAYRLIRIRELGKAKIVITRPVTPLFDTSNWREDLERASNYEDNASSYTGILTT